MSSPSASTQNEREPMPQIGLLEHERRYLLRSFQILVVVMLLLNLGGCRWFIGLQKQQGKSSLVRNLYPPRTSAGWPSMTPSLLAWPKPEKKAYFGGAVMFVRSVYATAWDDAGTHYSMEVIGCGMPLNSYEIRTIRVVQRDGTVRFAEPPIGTAPRIRLAPLGVLGNTLIHTSAAWLMIGVLPIVPSLIGRSTKASRWAELHLCQGCGYDIQDLPICPECGRPHHE
ncbi:MAG: hypothetical protein CMJ35_05665 [Phycisphaerae bacterium]|nr:hypothetical protein [Phycisphaerae bacterium]